MRSLSWCLMGKETVVVMVVVLSLKNQLVLVFSRGC